jgi:hypothetical protein
MKTIQIVTFLGAAALALGCGGGKEAAEELRKAAEAASKPTAEAPAADPAVAAVPTGPEPSRDKEFLGFDLQPMGDWKPTWDADAKTAKWENEAYMKSIIVRIASEKLDNIEDLKKEAPMMGQIGTAITTVKEEGKGANGWWAIVESDEGKGLDLIYVQKYGSKTVVCSAGLSGSMGDPIKKEVALKACDSLKLKP